MIKLIWGISLKRREKVSVGRDTEESRNLKESGGWHEVRCVCGPKMSPDPIGLGLQSSGLSPSPSPSPSLIRTRMAHFILGGQV